MENKLGEEQLLEHSKLQILLYLFRPLYAFKG